MMRKMLQRFTFSVKLHTRQKPWVTVLPLVVFIFVAGRLFVWPRWRSIQIPANCHVVVGEGLGRGVLRPCTDQTVTDVEKELGLNYTHPAVSPRDVELYEAAARHLKSLPPLEAQRLSPFQPLMTLEDKTRLLILWRILDHTLKRLNIPYFFYAGSLLGAVRHHGMIPWDDDLDILVWEKDDERLQRALSCIEGYTLLVQNNYLRKFFSDNAYGNTRDRPPPHILHAQKLSQAEKDEFGHNVTHMFEPNENIVYRYPSVDIAIARTFSEVTCCLWHHACDHVQNQHLLPLTTALFEGYVVSVPRYPFKLLEYVGRGFSDGLHVCKTRALNHGPVQTHNHSATLPCAQLKGMYPSVYGFNN